MKHSRHLSRLLAVLALAALPGIAEEPLTWEACVRLTAEHNPALVASRAKVRSAESAVGVAHSALLPQFSATASADRSYNDTREEDFITSYAAGLTVEQSLYSGGRKSAVVNSAKAGLAQQIAAASDSAAGITFALRSAFFDVLYFQELVSLLDTIEARRGNNLELVELRYEGGREHKGSLASSEASLFDAQVQLKQANRAVSASCRILAHTAGLTPVPEGVVITGVLGRATMPGDTDMEGLARKTPGYISSQASRTAAETRLAEARSGSRPNLSLAGSGGRSGDEDAFEEECWSVSLKLSFPFWSGGRTSHEISQAKADLLEAEANVADVLNGQLTGLTEAQRSLADAADNVGVQENYVAAAQIRAQIARQQYEDGLLSFENWVVIEDDLIAKRKQLLGAQRNASLAEAAWWKATGYDVFAELDIETGGEE